MKVQSIVKIMNGSHLSYAGQNTSKHKLYYNKQKEDIMTKERFEELLLTAREQYKQANKIMNELFNELIRQMPKVDLSLTPTHAEGSRSLEDALIHFMQDGRSDASVLWEDVEQVQEDAKNYERDMYD